MFSSFSANRLHKSRHHQLTTILLSKGVDFQEVDLSASSFKLENSQREKLPLVFVEHLCLGGWDEVQLLEDSDFLSSILLGKFKTHCLVCGSKRTQSKACKHCWHNYEFFELSQQSETQIHLSSSTTLRKNSV